MYAAHIYYVFLFGIRFSFKSFYQINFVLSRCFDVDIAAVVINNFKCHGQIFIKDIIRQFIGPFNCHYSPAVIQLIQADVLKIADAV